MFTIKNEMTIIKHRGPGIAYCSAMCHGGEFVYLVGFYSKNSFQILIN